MKSLSLVSNLVLYRQMIGVEWASRCRVLQSCRGGETQ